MIPDRYTAERCADLVQSAYAQQARPLVVADKPNCTWWIAFAGTRSVADMRIDVECWQNSAGVHAGFSAAADDLVKPFADAVSDAREWCPAPRIVITGHSLGAAVALLLAYRLTNLRLRAEVVVFGCPRVGGQTWHRFYGEARIPTLRVYCAHDPVAHVPGLVPGRWRHVGDALHIDEDGTPLRDPSSFLERARYWLGWPIGHLDHSMIGYEIALMAHDERGFAWPREDA